MKKNLLTLLMLALGVTGLFAGPVDLPTAQKAAEGFAHSSLALAAKADEMQLVTATENYYVFNFGNEGFVILSNDDVFRPVIGYSNEGAFPTENPSPEMMYYLDNLSEGRQFALRASLQQNAEVAREWEMLLSQGQLPSRNGNRGSFYLCTSKWNQNDPYNKFCPTGNGGGRSYAGCVATAMSQVMYYWRYPEHGFGNHTYTHYNYGEMSADFASAHYDFDHMPNSISNSSPVEQIDAIAYFMYHCGIAVDMDYSPSGSGAYSQDVPDAVLKYFGYSNRCRYYPRDNYSLEEFQNILKDQFDMGWPCYYSGTDTEGQGGHAFVCDGYDDNDLFHFNWGWGGSGDGFFAIDALNVSGYAFNSGQAVVANYVPADVFLNTPKAPDFFTAVPNGDEAFSVTLSWVNPTATLDGHDLESIDKIILVRDGAVVKVFDNPTPGEAVTYVDPAGIPMMVDYKIYAVCNNVSGRKANANDVNLGPTCTWSFELTSSSPEGWDEAGLAVFNASGLKVGTVSKDDMDGLRTMELPQGRVSFTWTAPSDSTEMSLRILNGEGNPVFSYNGPSYLMPTGIFFETVNTCGGSGSDVGPSQLQAVGEGHDVVLRWQGIDDPGYGYNVYRDGFLYTMVTDTTAFVDANALEASHDYFVTAYRAEGETDPSNIVTPCFEIDSAPAPRNFDYEILENGKTQLLWEAPEGGAEPAGYKIYRRTDDTEYKVAKIVGPNNLTYKDNSGATPGTRYYYQVVALYGNGHLESAPARNAQNPDLGCVMVNRTHLPAGLTLSEVRSDGRRFLLQWQPALLAESYNLYCNGNLVAEGITDTQVENVSHDGDLLVYQVTGVVNGVESSPSNKACYGNLAVDEHETDALRLFPNPTSGTLTVQAENLLAVEVYSSTGHRILSQKALANQVNLQLEGLKQGVYYLKVLTAQGWQSRKVVLIH